MTILPAGLLFGAHFVNDHLGTAAVRHHLQLNTGVLDIRLAKSCALGILHQKNVVEGDGCVDLSIEPVEIVVTIGLQPELLTGGFDDRVGPCFGISSW